MYSDSPFAAPGVPNEAEFVDECEMLGKGFDMFIPYWIDGGGLAGSGGIGGGSLESEESDCCDIEGRLIVEPEIDCVRSRRLSCEESDGDVAKPVIDAELTIDGAVVAVEPRRGFDLEKIFGIRTEDEASLRPATLELDECVFPWCSWCCD